MINYKWWFNNIIFTINAGLRPPNVTHYYLNQWYIYSGPFVCLCVCIWIYIYVYIVSGQLNWQELWSNCTESHEFVNVHIVLGRVLLFDHHILRPLSELELGPISQADLSQYLGLILKQSDSWLSWSLFVKLSPGEYLGRESAVFTSVTL